MMSAAELAQADREYHPRVGLHVCGWTAEDRPLTLANVPGISKAKFDEAKARFALPEGEDFDLLVDWFVDDYTYTDQFAIRRQSLDAMLKSCL
jgi:uncharacterized protein YhfF